MNFCPKDGTPRSGNFCVRCGFRFPVEQAAVAAAGWFPDTSLPGYERFWDGAQWTQEIRPIGQVVLPPPPTVTAQAAPAAPKEDIGERLVYGEGFSEKTNCLNCGTKLKAGKCPNCGDSEG